MVPERMNQAVQDAAYAVRGAIPLRADELRDQLDAGKQLPFNKVITCNIGNPQSMGQKPLTYLRQVSSHPLPLSCTLSLSLSTDCCGSFSTDGESKKEARGARSRKGEKKDGEMETAASTLDLGQQDAV